MKTLDQKTRIIGPARRKKVNGRATALIAEEVTLQSGLKGQSTTKVAFMPYAFASMKLFTSALLCLQLFF